MNSDRERRIGEGTEDYLPKPLQLQQPKEALARWLTSAADLKNAQEAPAPEARKPRIT